MIPIRSEKNSFYLPEKNARRLATILSNTPAIIYSYKMIDGKKTITYINENVKNVLGFEPQEIIKEPGLWTSRICPEDIALVENIPEVSDNEQPVHLEYRFNCKKGIRRWLHEKQNIITNDEGETEVVAICWDITERKLAEKLMQARVNLLSFSYNHTLEEVMQKTLDEVCNIVSSPLGFYHFVGDDEKTFTLKAWSSATLELYCKMKERSGMHYNIAEAGIWADCLRARRPVIHNNYASLLHRKRLPEGRVEVIRELVVPIMRRGKIVAVLGIGNKPLNYTDQDVQVVSYFADLAWTIAEHKRAEEKIRYISFHDVLTGLYNRAFFEEEMQRLETGRQLPISILMADLNGLKLVNDTYGHEAGDEMLKTVAGIIKKSCREEDIVARWGGDEFVILLPQTSEEKAGQIGKRIRSKCNSAYVGDVPVSLALGVATKEKQSDLLTDVLNKAEDIMYKQKLAESRSVRSTVLNTLLKTLEAKSFETGEHVCRMQMLAWDFGEKLKLPESEMNRLSLLVTLHDIGKINIPEEILTKKEPLTEEEWEIVKKHPETGFRIARSTEEFAHVAEDILAHHERWDGTGYPQGLKGEEIPFLARITSIVDAYEVMTNGRPYREKMSPEEAVAEIKRCSGTQFDPQLVELFLASREIQGSQSFLKGKYCIVSNNFIE